MKPKTQHTVDTLLARTDEFGDCLIWNGYSYHNTPQVHHDGKMVSVRALLWSLQGKTAPEGRLFYRVVCGQDKCVNPAHTRCHTQAEHMRYMNEPGRRTASGEAIRAAKIAQYRRRISRITPEMLAEILASHESGPELERRLGVSRSLISQYRRGELGATRISNPFQGLGAR